MTVADADIQKTSKEVGLTLRKIVFSNRVVIKWNSLSDCCTAL